MIKSINFLNLRLNSYNPIVLKLIRKIININVRILSVIFILLLIPHIYLISNYNFYFSFILNIVLNVLAVIIIVVYKIKENYNNYMTLTYNQLNNYLNLLSETNTTPAIAFAHDFKNMIFAMSNYMYFRDYDKVNQKIKDLCDMVKVVNNERYTGICCIDKLIAYKLKIMNNLNIKFDIVNDTSSPINIENLDLCIILGNSIDNAIEACSKIPDKQNRYINISLTDKKDFLEITVCNSIIDSSPVKLTTSKINKKYHGFGIKNIRTILQKYDGELYTDQFDNYFTITMKLHFKH